MSTFLSQARARALRPAGPPPRPRLTIVPRMVARAPRIPFVLLVVTVLGIGLVGLLLLNTSLQRGAYVAGALRSQSATLDSRQQDLEMSVAALQEPQRVSRQAERLGMVRDDSPAFLVLKTGKVLGVPTPGDASDVVDIGLVPPGSSTSGRKIADPPAGSHASLGTGAVTIRGKRPTPDHGSTNAGNTPPASPGAPATQGRNKPSTTSGQTSH